MRTLSGTPVVYLLVVIMIADLRHLNGLYQKSYMYPRVCGINLGLGLNRKLLRRENDTSNRF